MNTALIQPHDLLWGMHAEYICEQELPAWVVQVIRAGHPVVVRRAECAASWVAVGLRGQYRHQRFAAQMPIHAIRKVISPEQLIETDLDRFLHLKPKLENIYEAMQSLNMRWGYAGSVGFELATGFKTVNEHSDIDLIIRCEKPLSKLAAQKILKRLDGLVPKLDIQLQTPLGALALKEWAMTTKKVLVKCQNQAILVNDPWMFRNTT